MEHDFYGMNCSPILPNLWIGGRPPEFNREMPKYWDWLVLTAANIQPPDHHFPGMRIMRLPILDAPIDEEERKRAFVVGGGIASVVRRGQRVLVTCRQGRNRSGLLCAIALIHLGRTPNEAIAYVRKKRFPSLWNEDFTAFLRGPKAFLPKHATPSAA